MASIFLSCNLSKRSSCIFNFYQSKRFECNLKLNFFSNLTNLLMKNYSQSPVQCVIILYGLNNSKREFTLKSKAL